MQHLSNPQDVQITASPPKQESNLVSNVIREPRILPNIRTLPSRARYAYPGQYRDSRWVRTQSRSGGLEGVRLKYPVCHSLGCSSLLQTGTWSRVGGCVYHWLGFGPVDEQWRELTFFVSNNSCITELARRLDNLLFLIPSGDLKLCWMRWTGNLLRRVGSTNQYAPAKYQGWNS